MRMLPRPISCLATLLAFAVSPAGSLLAAPETSASAKPTWQWAGWGGGGFYYSALFHPTKDGVLYMGGDVAGMYKSEDHGRTFKLINNGIADFGVFSLAASAAAPDCVFAATEGGLCKSDDAGEHWRLLPNTGSKALRITGEKNRSIRCIAVDPVNAKIVYAGSPAGKVYKSTDGGETWKVAYEKSGEQDPPETLRVQYGKVNDAWFGGMWLSFAFPKDVTSADCAGFGFSFKGAGTLPQNCYLSLKAGDGAAYRSRDLREIFKQAQWGDVVLGPKDFVLDPEYAKKNPDKAKAYSGTPDWSAINRLDFSCVSPPTQDPSIAKFTRFFFALTRTPDGKTSPASVPSQHIVRDFAKDKSVQIYSNARVGSLQGGAVYSVAVAQKEPSLVIAATDDAGLLISNDAGQTWRSETALPKKASNIAIAASDPKILYATFFKEGIWKSTDKGQTWQNISQGLPKDSSLHEVAVSPANPPDVYLIGAAGWSGRFFYSNDGGKTWTASGKLTPDFEADPTLPKEYTGGGGTSLSTPKNITINPLNPKELYIAANWRPCHSEDGGRTWTERVRGADISCVYDVRFSKGRTYASAMDEGVLVSEDNGKRWRALCPLKFDPELSGHYWRLVITDNNGADRIVSTCSPWDTKYPNRAVMSEDGGKTFKRSVAGLPTTVPSANTMWGIGYARALAADPLNPKILYLGIDGDPSAGKTGGGVFKSEDGGATWRALPTQPGSKRMFFGLAVDPTESKRVFYGACGTGGGLYRSEDAGATWQLVFKNEQWIFNVHLASDGTVYCPGNNLWRSKDHGKSWQQITKLPFGGRVIVAVETDPTDAKRMWYAATSWGGGPDGGVYETRDAGATWQEITGDLPCPKPLILRYNPDTHELWAAGVCIYKCKR